jgi:hypothetical protein
MRYMMIIKATPDFEAGAPPNMAVMMGMGQLGEEMTKAGKLLESGGLQPSSQGMRLSCRNGKTSVIDGPFTETKELIAGYAVMEARSKQEAIELAQRAVDVHIKGGMLDIEIEVRPLFEVPQMGH